jgi:hypothetical protein
MTQEHTDPTPDAPETTTQPEAPQSGGNPPPNAEAAMRRRQLRAVEAERDALRERLDATHRAEVERMAADRFADPSDLWAATSLDEMRGDDGLIDPAKATAAMDEALQQKPHWRKPPSEPEPPEFPELHQGAREPVEEKPSFGAVLKKELGR